MAKENKEKIGFFKRIFLAVKEFEQYGIFAAEDVSVSIKYLLKIMLIFVLVVSGIFMYQFHTYFQGAVEYFNNNINEVYFLDGYLVLNQGDKIEIRNDTSILPYILIDTDASNEEIESYQNELNHYSTGILMLNNKLIYKNDLLNQTVEYQYSDLLANYGIQEFHKQDIVNLIEGIDKVSLYVSIFIILFIYLYMIYFATALVDIIMLAVLGFIVGRMVGIKIRLKATFNIGIYAITLPILLNLVYVIVRNLTGFTIQYFSWMYTTISYIYVIVAILMIRTDFINKQVELMKILEEQERVRQQMKWQEEQKKKEEEKNENKDNKDNNDEPKEEKKKSKKKEKDENSLGEGGLAPQETRRIAK